MRGCWRICYNPDLKQRILDPKPKELIYQFGNFELSTRAGELRKGGAVLRIPPQPTLVLLRLVARSGELVTREELRQEIWKDNTNVDFELGVNRCIRRIRATLLDDADSPRYIETVPRVGYRFIAPVRCIPEQRSDAPAPEQMRNEPGTLVAEAGEGGLAVRQSPEAVERQSEERGQPRSSPPRQARSSVMLWGAVALGLVAAGYGSYSWWHGGQEVELSPNYTVQPFTSDAGIAAGPAFSPDGREIAYSWNGVHQDNFDIYLKETGTQRVKRLTTSPESDYSPAWSPDGRSIAFCRGSGHESSAIWLISLSNGAERKLAELQWDAAPGSRYLTWSPDSKRIVYAGSATDERVNGLFELDVATSAIQRLTSAQRGATDLHPAYAPDGRQVAFARDIGSGVSRIWLLPMKQGGGADGNPVMLEWPGFESATSSRPVWTPDSRYLVFSSNRMGQAALWLVRPTPGAKPRSLAALGAGNTDGAISSRGQLALVRHHQDVDIYQLEVDLLRRGLASAPKPVLNSTQMESNPQVSPDGSKIAMESNRGGFREIWTANTDSTNLTQVTSLMNPISGSPAWSPDGRKIAFDSRVGGVPRIFIVPGQGGKAEAVTAAEFAGVVPTWSPDGAWIYYSSGRSGRSELWRIASTGGAAQQVTRNGGFSPVIAYNRLIYAANQARVTSLRELNLKTNEETNLATGVMRRDYCPSVDGVYYIVPGAGGGYTLKFLPSTPNPPKTIFQFTAQPAEGMSLSPDGLVLYYGQSEKSGSDLLLVQDFWRN
ncbi:winged helix-turn-helix domain-containing protein [Paludibaculum fermentans]|uniref:winged helix-turn-helix domain-containing protein n=1 Tax=Paludibaculum fermentans TaxID=1473598 RepID=UPI003EB81F70